MQLVLITFIHSHFPRPRCAACVQGSGVSCKVDMIIVSLRFSQKRAPNDYRFSRKMCDYRDNRCREKLNSSDNRCKQVCSRALYGPMFSPRPLSPLRPYVLSAASVLSTAVCSIYGPLSPLRSSVASVLSMALCFTLFPKQPSVPYYSPLSLLLASALSMALCIFTSLCTLYGPLLPLKSSELSSLHILSRDFASKMSERVSELHSSLKKI